MPKVKLISYDELLVRARSLMPEYATCRRCGRALCGPLTVKRGIGPTCELREMVEDMEKAELKGKAPRRLRRA